jgi:hypothetical protein
MSTLIDDCIKAWLWISDPDNLQDGSFRVNKLHKCSYKNRKRAEVDSVLTRLEQAGVVGPEFKGSCISGRRADMRSVAPEWVPADTEARQVLEIKLRGTLTPNTGIAVPPTANVPPDTAPVRILRDVSICGARLRAGSVVTDPTLCRALRQCLPGSKPWADLDDQNAAYCEFCHWTFDRSESKAPYAPLIALGDFSFTFTNGHHLSGNRVSIRRKRGELIVEPDTIMAIKRAGVSPAAEAVEDEYAYCPRCRCFNSSARFR